MLDILEPGTDNSRLVVGIDLGTTNSLVAYINPQGQAQVLPDATGKTTLPSVVSYRADGLVNVGAELPEAMATIRSAKRYMGRSVEEGAGFKVGSVTVSPVEVSAQILRTLKRRAEQHLGQDVFEAVITVPAYFDDAQRQATKDAAKLAGLNVLRLLPEPTAAAVAYGLDKKVQGSFLVYDLGGGTFDVSVLKLVDGVFQVLATVGDTQLGGDDIDTFVVQSLGCAQGFARQLKEELTVKNEATKEGFSLTREALEKLARPLVDKTLEICDRALADAGLKADELDGVILVGGQTRMPFIRDALEKHLGHKPLTDLNPDEIVAVGAALQADNLTRGKCAEFLLLDVNPLSLGLETMGGLVEKIIPRNTPIPITKAAEFTTYQDGQTAIKIHVVQGEREMVNDCRSLATFTLRGIPPLKAGEAKVQVVFALDGDGILMVRAKDLTTGVEQQVEVKPTYGVSEEQMVQMLKDSLTFAAQDVQTRKLAEARLELERSILAAMTALDEEKKALTADEVNVMRGALQQAKDSLNSLDANHLADQQHRLEAAFTPIVAKRMEKVLQHKVVGRGLKEVQHDL